MTAFGVRALAQRRLTGDAGFRGSRAAPALPRGGPGCCSCWPCWGRFFATRPVIAKALARWGHILLPVVLIALGLLILIEGGAFGL